MRNGLKLLLPLLLFLAFSFAGKADFPKWKSFTSLNIVNTVYRQGNIMWVGTTGGLLKYDMQSGAKTLYTKANSGIPSNAVETIKEDGSGNIWIGTYDAGIAMFNGKQWTPYNYSNSELPGNAVLSIVIDKNDNKWVGTDSGLAVLSGNTWKVYNSTNSGLLNTDIWCMDMDKNNVLWIGCASATYSFDGKHFKNYSDSVNIYGTEAMMCDSAGNTFIGGLGGLFKFNGKFFTKMGNDSMSDEILRYTKRVSMAPNGDLWVSTGQTVSVLSNGAWTHYDYTNSALQAPKSIMADQDGNVWAGTATGLFKFDNNSWKLQQQLSSPMQTNYIKKIASDKNGKIWFTDGSSISSFDGTDYKNYTIDMGPLSYYMVNTFYIQNPSTIWIATATKGLLKMENGVITQYSRANSNIPVDNISAVSCDSKGNVWVGYASGVSKFDGKDWTHYDIEVTQIGQTVTALAFDAQDKLWIGTNADKIIYFDGTDMNEYSLYKHTFAGGYVYDIRVDKDGKVWAGSWGGGLNQFDGDKWNSITDYGIVVADVVPDGNGNIWGITSYENRLFKYGSQPEVFNVDNSPLQKGNTYSIDMDEKGNIWMATSNGILMYEAQSGSSGIAHNQKPSYTVNIYPNPSSQFISADIKSAGNGAEVSIMDVSGRLISSEKFNAGQTGQINYRKDVSQFKPGLYILKVSGSQSSFENSFVVTH